MISGEYTEMITLDYIGLAEIILHQVMLECIGLNQTGLGLDQINLD